MEFTLDLALAKLGSKKYLETVVPELFHLKGDTSIPKLAELIVRATQDIDGPVRMLYPLPRTVIEGQNYRAEIDGLISSIKQLAPNLQMWAVIYDEEFVSPSIPNIVTPVYLLSSLGELYDAVYRHVPRLNRGKYTLAASGLAMIDFNRSTSEILPSIYVHLRGLSRARESWEQSILMEFTDIILRSLISAKNTSRSINDLDLPYADVALVSEIVGEWGVHLMQFSLLPSNTSEDKWESAKKKFIEALAHEFAIWWIFTGTCDIPADGTSLTYNVFTTVCQSVLTVDMLRECVDKARLLADILVRGDHFSKKPTEPILNPTSIEEELMHAGELTEYDITQILDRHSDVPIQADAVTMLVSGPLVAMIIEEYGRESLTLNSGNTTGGFYYKFNDGNNEYILFTVRPSDDHVYGARRVPEGIELIELSGKPGFDYVYSY